jgi:hypothetical protein
VVVVLRGDGGESVVVVISGSGNGYGEAVVIFSVVFVVWW